MFFSPPTFKPQGVDNGGVRGNRLRATCIYRYHPMTQRLSGMLSLMVGYQVMQLPLLQRLNQGLAMQTYRWLV